jgi:predicted small secreted protein
MSANRRFLALISALALAGVVSACGDTWEGLKKDTGENL